MTLRVNAQFQCTNGKGILYTPGAAKEYQGGRTTTVSVVLDRDYKKVDPTTDEIREHVNANFEKVWNEFALGTDGQNVATVSVKAIDQPLMVRRYFDIDPNADPDAPTFEDHHLAVGEIVEADTVKGTIITLLPIGIG